MAAAGRRAEIPVAAMLDLSADDIRRRAERLAAVLAAPLSGDIVDGESTIGGGSAPGATLPTWLVRLTHQALSATALEQRLRSLDPPIVARIIDDHVVLDLRTVRPEQDSTLAELLSIPNAQRPTPKTSL
jgi:L-seryl-tRNA(Ser) seleniumtransferase